MMQYAYLDFVSTLQTVFNVIFKEVLEPILSDILEIYVRFILDIVWDLFGEVFLTLLIQLCSMIDFIEKIFNVFAGVETVTVSGQQTTLLNAIFQINDVSRIFYGVTAMALAMCMIFTIYKTAKSIADMALEDKNPISKVMGDALKACVTFAMIPFLCIFLLQMSTAVTKQVVAAFNASQNTESSASIGTILFLTAGQEADKSVEQKYSWRKISGQTDDSANSDTSQAVRNASFQKSPWKEYITGERDYRDQDEVEKYFYPSDFDFILGFIAGITLFLIMAGAALNFVRRIFELLILYLVSPFFVSTIPLDEGTVFAKWRELFVAKFFSAFGSIFAMKYYLLLVQKLVSSELYLYDTSLPGGERIQSILRIFLIIGGAWTVYQGQTRIMEILAPESAMAEHEARSMMTGMVRGGASAARAAAGGGIALAKRKTKAAGQSFMAARNLKSSMNQRSEKDEEYDSQGENGDDGGGSEA